MLQNIKDSIVGKRIKITYFDQNESFASILPRKGTITKKLKAKDNVYNSFLLKLDEPFDYQIKINEPFLHCEELLISSRWKNNQIGESEPTSIFISLIQDKKHLDTEPIQMEDFYLVAWGMAHTE